MKTIIVKINASKRVEIDKSSINTLELRKSLVNEISKVTRPSNRIEVRGGTGENLIVTIFK